LGLRDAFRKQPTPEETQAYRMAGGVIEAVARAGERGGEVSSASVYAAECAERLRKAYEVRSWGQVSEEFYSMNELVKLANEEAEQDGG
jgi:hypothetical protein